jgi:hypothetical protein
LLKVSSFSLAKNTQSDEEVLMYHYLISALKRRLVLELKDIFSRHPVYEKVVPYIQNKYSFDERPQYGIVVKGSTANKVALSGDNYLGTIESYLMLAYVNQPAYPIEWVREDTPTIQANNNVFPLAPGIYYIDVLSVPTPDQQPGQFMIDPLIRVTDEPVLQFQSGIEREAQLQVPPLQNTLRLWENRRYLLKEGTDYTIDYKTGAITLKGRYNRSAILTADYFYPVDSMGPFNFYWNTSDATSLPGVVMAFGKRARVGDKVAVVIYPDRVDTAQAFGGKLELTFDVDVIAQDPAQMEEIADHAMISLWSEKKPALETEGIEVLDVSISGEAEEMQDETAQIFFYTASMSVQLRSDWEVHIPLPLTLTLVSDAPADIPTDDNRGTTAKSGLKVVSNGLVYATVPIMIPGRNADFERIT